MLERDRVLQQLQWRYATKKFDPTRKISEADWHVLEESLRLSPSSWGLQPWKFIVAQSQALRDALSEHNGNYVQFQTCSHLLIIASLKEMDEAFVERSIAARGSQGAELARQTSSVSKAVVHGHLKEIMPHWCARQAYIALGFFLESAAMLGIDACPMEGINHERFDELLGLKSGPYASVVAVAAGYRPADEPQERGPKVRFSRDEVIKFM